MPRNVSSPVAGSVMPTTVPVPFNVTEGAAPFCAYVGTARKASNTNQTRKSMVEGSGRTQGSDESRVSSLGFCILHGLKGGAALGSVTQGNRQLNCSLTRV